MTARFSWNPRNPGHSPLDPPLTSGELPKLKAVRREPGDYLRFELPDMSSDVVAGRFPLFNGRGPADLASCKELKKSHTWQSLISLVRFWSSFSANLNVLPIPTSIPPHSAPAPDNLLYSSAFSSAWPFCHFPFFRRPHRLLLTAQTAAECANESALMIRIDINNG